MECGSRCATFLDADEQCDAIPFAADRLHVCGIHSRNAGDLAFQIAAGRRNRIAGRQVRGGEDLFRGYLAEAVEIDVANVRQLCRGGTHQHYARKHSRRMIQTCHLPPMLRGNL